MKKIIIFGICMFALVFMQFANAQSVDDIVNKYVAAMGGKEKLASLKTVRLQGNLSVMGNDVAMVITKKHLVGMRADISVMGTENYQIITPAKGIVFMPVQGMSEPTPMTDDQLKASQSQLDLQGYLVDYKEKGTTIELLGNEKVDGDDNFKLKLTFKNGIVSTCFVSSKNYMITKTSAKRNVNGEEMDMEVTYTNYKQNADGYWFAYTTGSMQGETNYEKIETNITVDESIFK